MLCGTLCAQEVKYPNAKLIAKGKYDKAEKAMNKAYQKDSSDVLNIYAMYKLMADTAYSKHNDDKAYRYIAKAYKTWRGLDEKSRNKLGKKNVTQEVFLGDLQNATDRGLQNAIAANSIASYEHYLDYYKEFARADQKEKATDGRNKLEFEIVKEKNTEEDYQRFIAKRPYAKERSEAERLRNEVAYKTASDINTVESYQSFISKYPTAKEVPAAKKNMHKLAYDQACKVNTEAAYRSYAAKYPESIYAEEAVYKADAMQFAGETTEGDWESYRRYIERHGNNKNLVFKAQKIIRDIACKTKNIEALDYGVTHFPSALRDTMVEVLHDVYIDCWELNDYYERYGDYTDDDTRNTDMAIIKAAREIDEEEPQTIENFIKAAAPYHVAYQCLVGLINQDLKQKNWPKALKVVEQFADDFGDDSNYLSLRKMLSKPLDKSIKVTAFPATINTKEGDEYDGWQTADGKHLYFCAKNRPDNLWGEDIYVSTKDNRGNWSKATLVYDLSEYYSNDAPVSVFADGTSMILFRSGQLAISEKTATGWSDPEYLPKEINCSDWQADAMITSDGNAMFFAARKKIDSELEESVNVFVSELNEEGEWSEPIDIGPVINTPGTDRSPFLHPDMKTLYFCSDRHSTLGGLDVFMSTRLSDDSWTEWSEPVNLGKEISSTGDDCWYRISTDGAKAVFSKLQDNNQDIYWLSLPDHMRPDRVATISGKLLDKKQQPVVAEIKWEDLQTHEYIGHSKTDPADGSFFIVLPMGRIYGYYVDNDDYFPVSDNIDLRTSDQAVEIKEDISVVSFQQMIEEEIPAPVNNLFFDIDKADLLPYSIPELRRVAAIIKKNNLNVEIAGHTDSTGTAEHNMDLSRRRATSVRNFLIKEGCKADKMTIVGHGSTMPVASNETEEGRRKNRRVEITFKK